MNTSWKTCELQQIAKQEKGSIVSGPFGSNIGSRFFVDEGIPVIRGNNLTKGQQYFIDSGFVFLTEEKSTEFKNCVARAGDIVFTAAGSIGQVGIIPFETRFPYYIISNKQIRVRINEDVADPLFIYLWLSSRGMIRYLENKNNGGAVPLLNLGLIRKIPVPLPPLETQKAISGLLGNYDDLIANNKRRAELLEQSARLLFKEWFVCLRYPGHEHDKRYGGVPKGWKRSLITDIWSIKYGNNLPTEKISPSGQFPVHGADSIIGYYDKSNVNGSVCLVTCRGNGSGNIRRTYGPAFVTNNSFVFQPLETHGNIRFHYAMFALEGLGLRELRTGAAQPQLTLAGIGHLRLTLGPEELIATYNGIVDTIFQQVDNLGAQNRRLAQGRDLLLPRLMDGRLNI